MRMFKRATAAVALAAGLAAVVPAAPAMASDSRGGTYVCVKYTYVYVAGSWYPTLQTVAITSDPTYCDSAIQVI